MARHAIAPELAEFHATQIVKPATTCGNGFVASGQQQPETIVRGEIIQKRRQARRQIGFPQDFDKVSNFAKVFHMQDLITIVL
jgi:hypothetical protein